MQRYGNNEVGFLQKRAAGAFKPARKGRRVIQTVSVFESENERLGGLVIAKQRACLSEVVWLGEARAANGLAARIDVEGRAARRAERLLDEGDSAPARGAERMRLRHTRATRHATR